MGFKMQNRESILNKIVAQERAWETQVKYLQSKVTTFDAKKREELEKYVNHLNSKLSNISKRTNELKTANISVWEKYGDNIAECWEELVHNVDYVISNYIRIFNQ